VSKIRIIVTPNHIKSAALAAANHLKKTVLRALGYSEDEAGQILDHLYPALASEVEQLKRLMQG
jgi:hypothetical protein